MPPLRRQDRHADEALDPAEAGGTFDDGQPVVNALGESVLAVQVETDHAAEANHLSCGDFVIGVRGETRVIHASHPAVLFEERGNRLRVGVVAGDPQGKRFQPSSERVRRVRIHHGPHQPARFLDWRHQRRGTRDHAAGDVAVPVEVLRRTLHHQIHAQRQRLLVDRTRKRVIDHRQHSAGATRARQPADVDAPQRRIGGRFEPHHPRAVGEEAIGIGERVERNESRSHAEPPQYILQQVERAAIDRGAADHLVAGVHVRQQDRGCSALAG